MRGRLMRGTGGHVRRGGALEKGQTTRSNTIRPIKTHSAMSPPGVPSRGSSERESTQENEITVLLVLTNEALLTLTSKCCATAACRYGAIGVECVVRQVGLVSGRVQHQRRRAAGEGGGGAASLGRGRARSLQGTARLPAGRQRCACPGRRQGQAAATHPVVGVRRQGARGGGDGGRGGHRSCTEDTTQAEASGSSSAARRSALGAMASGWFGRRLERGRGGVPSCVGGRLPSGVMKGWRGMRVPRGGATRCWGCQVARAPAKWSILGMPRFIKWVLNQGRSPEGRPQLQYQTTGSKSVPPYTHRVTPGSTCMGGPWRRTDHGCTSGAHTDW